MMSNTSQQISFDRIHLKTDGRIVFVPLRSINSMESAGNYVEVFVGKQDEKLLVRGTLSSFEERLDGRYFVRIHRSVIVNVARIREMRPRYTGEYQVTMDNGKQLTLSRGYRSNLKRLLQACLIPTQVAS
jgi:two-component system, LytTR family, response regulator